MLDTVGKVLECPIRGRLAEAIRAIVDLNPRQFDFREERSKLNTTMKVVERISKAHSGQSRRAVFLVTVIVRSD